MYLCEKKNDENIWPKKAQEKCLFGPFVDGKVFFKRFRKVSILDTSAN